MNELHSNMYLHIDTGTHCRLFCQWMVKSKISRWKSKSKTSIKLGFHVFIYRCCIVACDEASGARAGKRILQTNANLIKTNVYLNNKVFLLKSLKKLKIKQVNTKIIDVPNKLTPFKRVHSGWVNAFKTQFKSISNCYNSFYRDVLNEWVDPIGM